MGKGKNIERQVAVELVVSYPEKRSIKITVSYPFVNGVFCVKNTFVALFQKAIGRVQDKVLSFGFPIGIISAGHFVPINVEPNGRNPKLSLIGDGFGFLLFIGYFT